MQRNRDQVQGQADEGPSEIETTHSPEGRQLASASYRESYAKYRRKTEAALNSEPIPLGHRQTIRRYFGADPAPGRGCRKVDRENSCRRQTMSPGLSAPRRPVCFSERPAGCEFTLPALAGFAPASPAVSWRNKARLARGRAGAGLPVSIPSRSLLCRTD